MARVVETFSPSRNNVSKSNNDGNTENCKGSVIFIELRSTNSASEILMINNILKSHVGSGIISMATIKITPRNTDSSLTDIAFPPFAID
jgi:hypothetical protein